MADPRPTKRVHFRDVNSTTHPTRSPSAQDIYKWTNTIKATAPCFIRDVLSMREKVTEGYFYWLGHIPCRIVHIIGVVVGIDVSDKWTVYTVDDHTGVIECMLRHPPPYANIDIKSMSTEDLCTLRKRPLPPPPPTVTAIGYPVDVIGKVMTFHGGRRITAISIRGCNSTNDQWKHVVTVVELHKSAYSVPKPFEIPVEMDSDILEKSIKCPSSPLTHSATSRPSTFIMPDQFIHPSQLRTADLTDNTFRLYLKHHIHNALGNICDIASPAFTLSHLRRIPELALLASRVVHAEMRRRPQPHAHAAQTRNSNLLRVRMKRLFMWAILRLYEEGSIVLYDKPLIAISLYPSVPNLPSTDLANSPGSCNTQQYVTSDDEAYLSDPPPLEEDEAYVPVTATLLSQPVQEIMSARGIRGKSARVRPEDILSDLKQLDCRWACIDLQTVDEAIDTIVIA
ncbi:hypothetical protein DEU56DRAFT_749973 [Suillus clintonianus]|uniref:uncharacterized protein n=1 Tax=Suillus clintonianus TaxID=1904413 RepID=UPI001B8835CE|nr:uncharacterized protein DEU56DRAFT_749973 [Suillus clintonianus]KAG2109524.1 hypothetical protein DEU56DRAFT_749973 [Suillus clintonianus]